MAINNFSYPIMLKKIACIIFVLTSLGPSGPFELYFEAKIETRGN